MHESATKTLLALWLALKDTEVRLSPDEESVLDDISLRVALRPDTWESIEKDLMVSICENAVLHQAYQKIAPEVDKMDNEELLDLLPSQTEIDRARTDIGKVGMFDVQSARKAATESGVLAQLLADISLRMTKAKLPTARDCQKRSHQEVAKREAALALACELLDELELGWDVEWQQAAITDLNIPQVSNEQFTTVDTSPKRNIQEAEDENAALALACELLDRIELGWDA